MKTRDIFILISAAAYSYLFYEQWAGINFFLFNIIVVGMFATLNRQLITKPSWLAVATGCVVSSFCIFWWGTWLPIIANVISLVMLFGISHGPQQSLLVAALNGMVSVIISFFATLFTPRAANAGEHSSGIFRTVAILIVPICITIFFFVLYREANPVFEKFTDVDFDNFFSLWWCIFTAAGFYTMFGAFRHFGVPGLINADANAPDALTYRSADDHAHSDWGKMFSLQSELLTGIVMFSMLNILLLLVNSLDIYYMYILHRLPEGVTTAEYLHDATDLLILSIVFAIIIILFVFRSHLNFVAKNKPLVWLCCIWIAQNALMLITTAQRNWWNIQTTGLTHKRIGVYIYLLLCLIGLVTTFIKVYNRKNNWFLFRKNAWAFYAVLILSCPINWDAMIVRFNCTRYLSTEFGYIDRFYHSSLSHTSLALQFEYYRDELKDSTRRKLFPDDAVRMMHHKYNYLQGTYPKADWQSTCISKGKNLEAIAAMIKSGEVPPPPKLKSRQ